MLYDIAHCVVLGDMLMCLHNQCLPYEMRKGDTQRVTDKWIGEKMYYPFKVQDWLFH